MTIEVVYHKKVWHTVRMQVHTGRMEHFRKIWQRRQ
jgi:hypothetical protein